VSRFPAMAFGCSMNGAGASPSLYHGFPFLGFDLTINATPRRDSDIPAGCGTRNRIAPLTLFYIIDF
jgi:hypothetical protein